MYYIFLPEHKIILSEALTEVSLLFCFGLQEIGLNFAFDEYLTLFEEIEQL